MPYIKMELRHPFDMAVSFALTGNALGAKEAILLAIKDKDDMAIDGCLNYAFTQLLRKINLGIARDIIRLVSFVVFLNPPRYAYLERAVGLLDCMIDEFKRRGWEKEAIPILEELLKQVKEIRDRYEGGKILKNGDLK